MPMPINRREVPTTESVVDAPPPADQNKPEEMEVDENNVANNEEANATTTMEVSAENKEEATASATTAEEEEQGSARSEATFRFTVDNISRLREQVLSPPTFVRNLPWRIMVMPRSDSGGGGGGGGGGGQRGANNMSLGFFLQCNGDSDSASWNCSAVANLKIVSHKAGCEPFSRKISHIFHSKENDWGYSNFVDWPALIDPAKAFVKNDSITLEVDVKADAPHGVAWDSKKHTGFVGLKNQGATCYMNSLLQTLFFTNQLRKAVYKMPTESDDSTKSVALALQRVFYELQTSDKPVGTKKLTRSFGWETLDSFMQHDVQEFLRVLLDKLESKMKATCVEGLVPRLFEGKMISFIKCKHVTYESSRSETYYDIQLNVKGKKDIYESFRDYVATEVLDGDNKYDAGNHGLQEAEKGVIFTSFPPVLHLHLMRFQYDPITDCSVKSNDRFEFFEKIDLKDFLKEDVTEDSSTYTLHAVLVHSGDNHGGHYVVFINPKGDGRWCKFDDDVVSRCTKTEAVVHNFGGQEMDDLHPGVKQSTNAYMLVYIRDSNLNQVLQEVTEDDIPRELLERLKEEKTLELLKRKERSEAHLYMQVTVMLEDAFVGHQGCDLYDPEKLSPAANAGSRTFRVLKKMKPTNFLVLISDSFNIPLARLRLWPFTVRSNKAIRPGYLDMSPDSSKTLEESQYGHSLPIFLEMLPSDSEEDKLPTFDKENDVILFLKMYDPWNESLHYYGHFCVPITTTFSTIARECRRRAYWTEDTPITLYEEVQPGNIEKVVDLSATLDQGLDELMDGDIVVFHRTFESNRNNTSNNKLKSLGEFYVYMQYKYEITFLDKAGILDTFSIEISLKSTYFEMAQVVAQRLGIQPLFLQFFKAQPYKDSPAYAVKFEPDGDLLSILTPAHKPIRSPYKLFYQVLGIPVTELEHKKQFKMIFYQPNWPTSGSISDQEEKEREITYYVNKAPRLLLRDLMSELGKVVNKSGPPLRHLRVLEIVQHKIISILDEDSSCDVLLNTGNNQKYYRAEEIPEDEQEMNQGTEILVAVSHFHKEYRNTFGVPFLIKVRYGMLWSSVKQQVQHRLGIKDVEFSKLRLALIHQGQTTYIDNKDEDNEAAAAGVVKPEHFSSYSQSFGGRPYIGIEHVSKVIPKKTSRFQSLEKAIKIYN